MLVRGLRVNLACLLILLSGTCRCLWSSDSAIGNPEAARPNVVWLISEDNSVHYQKLFCEHGTETPRIAEMAVHGLKFNHAFSGAPVCSVARTTLITGCYAPRIGAQFHRRAVSVPMPDGLKMFPALLREAGYYTTNKQKKDYNADESQGTWDASSKRASWRNRAVGQPFFHMQSFATTHESSLHFDARDFKSKPTLTNPDDVFIAPYHPDTPLFRYTVARYHDNLQRVDRQIGEVLDMLAADGLLEDTFVFYFGDHGGVLPRGKGYAYESGLHIPLVIRVPEKWKHLVAWKIGDSGADVNGFVHFVDFGPTVLNLAGVTIPDQVDGRPFLGVGITADEVDSRDTAFGYADRFDEKSDFVRTIRKGKYEYVRSYQPFNFDGLQNNYRYIMLAYQQWRKMYQAGELNDIQSQFFQVRPAEMLFDLEADPYEINNLADAPELATVLHELRRELQRQLRSMPDLSFYAESRLAERAFENPVQFGEAHRQEISQLMTIADLQLQPFADAHSAIEKALASDSPEERQWGLIVCTTFGAEAKPMFARARELADNDPSVLVRTRAAEFLGMTGAGDPRPTIMDCLAQTSSGIEANLILNSVVLLEDGPQNWQFDIAAKHLQPAVANFPEVKRRLDYLATPDKKSKLQNTTP